MSRKRAELYAMEGGALEAEAMMRAITVANSARMEQVDLNRLVSKLEARMDLRPNVERVEAGHQKLRSLLRGKRSR